jgi:hypothetical protein
MVRRKLHNKMCHNLYSRVIKLAEYVACGGDEKYIYARMILKYLKYDVSVWTGFNCLKIGSSGRAFECSNEPLDSIKGWKFLD